MRTHGTLVRWNDDRGFGFITPSKGPPDIFVHISSFPRDGGRPQINELISFEVEAGRDGKPRAVRIMRPAQRAPAQRVTERPAVSRTPRREGRRGTGLIALLVAAGVGAYGYSWVSRHTAPAIQPLEEQTEQAAISDPAYTCDGRTMCSQMTSCEEATYFIRNCPNTQMDGDGDGSPCEQQWCK